MCSMTNRTSRMSRTSRRVLHQFPISHYCEKTRWHLDAKGLAYEARNLLPGLHAVINRRIAGSPSVPVLIDDGAVVADSTDIALHLEDKYREKPLVPRSGAERERVLELEAYFDDTFGPHVRRWLYGEALATPKLVTQLFFEGYGPGGKLFGRMTGARLEEQIRRMYRIDSASVAKSVTRIDEAALRLEGEIDGDPERYLVGGALTLADIAAASLLAPLIGPPGSPWEGADTPPALVARRGELRDRPVGQWVLRRYAKDRRAASSPGRS